MPPASNTIISSYADITSNPRKSPEIVVSTSARMDTPTDTPGREDSSKNPDNNHDEINPSKQIEEPSRQGEKNVDPTPGASNVYPQVIPPHQETPQQHTYYGAYSNSQVTPESPSPNNSSGRAVYNGGSFFQPQPAGFQSSPFTNDPYAGAPASQPPSSPTQSMGGIPPASPLFPRMTGPMPGYLNTSRGGETGVNQGMSPVPSGYASSSGMYIQGTYPMLAGRPNGSSNTNNVTLNNSNVSEEFMGWNDNRSPPYSLSPGQGGMPYVPGMLPRADRSASFDDSVLPHSSSDGSQSGYGAGPGSGPQAWGYGAPPPDPYGNNSNVTQGRPSGPYPGQPGGPQYRQPSQYGGPYGGHFGFPTTSPGPPIQTTSSNKGPDGANLFIFHIPNHFTNLDMYQLFCPYGNLLSVRIMVEKDSGRSRGFGFVSYDNPDAAALAIKELNGFAIGNKRLKVQHKQIRPAEQQNHDMSHGMHGHHHGGRGRGGRGGYGGRGGGNNLPPSGSMTMPSTGWYNNNPGSPSVTPVEADPQHVVVVLGDGPSNSTNVAAAENVNTSPAVIGEEEQKVNADPLSSMEPLRQSLPEMGGAAAPPVPGEN